MNKKILYLVSFVFVAVILCSFLGVIFAQQNNSAMPGMNQNKVYSVTGKVLYTEFHKRGESSLVVEDRNKKKVEIFLKDIAPNAEILVTYRKSKDAKGKEQNSAITLSVIRPAVMHIKKKTR